jgi:hypothetical protein
VVGGPFQSLLPLTAPASGAGLFAKDDNTIIYAGNNSNTIYEASGFVNLSTLATTKMFDMTGLTSPDTRYVIGDLLLTSDNNLIVATRDTLTLPSNFYITQYSYPSGVCNFEWNINSTALINPSTSVSSITGIFEYQNDVYVTTNLTNSPIYKLSNPTPGQTPTAVLIGNINTSLAGASSYLNCNTKKFS